MKKIILCLFTFCAFTAQVSATSTTDNSLEDKDYNFAVCFKPMAVRPMQENLEFAEESVKKSGTDTDNEDHFLKPKFKFGFKVGSELRKKDSKWSWMSCYTQWKNDVTGSASVSGNSYSSTAASTLEGKIADAGGATKMSIGSPTASASVDTSLEYKYKTFDSAAAWSHLLCDDMLRITAFGGYRGLKYKTTVSELNKESSGTTFAADGNTSTATNDYFGHGMRAGAKFDYNLFSCLSVCGKAATSLVGGYNTNEITLKQVSGDTTDKEKIALILGNVEAGLSLAWNQEVAGHNLHIGAGWEVSNWMGAVPHAFRQNSTSPGNATKTHNWLFTQGIVGSIGFTF